MTNAEKFIEIMNNTFDAGFTPENLDKDCAFWRLNRKDRSCTFSCEDCHKWWDKEYVKPERRTANDNQ